MKLEELEKLEVVNITDEVPLLEELEKLEVVNITDEVPLLDELYVSISNNKIYGIAYGNKIHIVPYVFKGKE